MSKNEHLIAKIGIGTAEMRIAQGRGRASQELGERSDFCPSRLLSDFAFLRAHFEGALKAARPGSASTGLSSASRT
jgi:hypothetical protein